MNRIMACALIDGELTPVAFSYFEHDDKREEEPVLIVWMYPALRRYVEGKPWTDTTERL